MVSQRSQSPKGTHERPAAARGPAPGGAEPALAGAAESGAGRGSSTRRRRRSRTEWAALVADFEASDQDAETFARLHDVSQLSLRHWKRRLGKGRAGAARRAPRRHFTPDERRAAVEAFEKSGRSAADFGKLWGCSPSSLTKWQARRRAEGPRGLEPRPRKPRTDTPHPARLPESVRDEVEATRRAHPDFGLRRVAAFLRRFRGLQISPSTVGNVLRERGLPAPIGRVPGRERSVRHCAVDVRGGAGHLPRCAGQGSSRDPGLPGRPGPPALVPRPPAGRRTSRAQDSGIHGSRDGCLPGRLQTARSDPRVTGTKS